MLDALIAYFSRNYPLTEEEISLIGSVIIPKKLKKGEFLLLEGDPVKYGAFVKMQALPFS